MFWIVGGLAGLATVFVKLGAYSVWMLVFKWLTAIFGIALALGVTGFVIKRIFSSMES